MARGMWWGGLREADYLDSRHSLLGLGCGRAPDIQRCRGMSKDRVSIAVIKHHDQKASWGERVKGLFVLYFLIAIHHQRKSG